MFDCLQQHIPYAGLRVPCSHQERTRPWGWGHGHPNAALGIRLQPLPPPCPCPPVVQHCRARSNFACSTSEGKFLPPPHEQHRQLQPSSKLFNEQAFILAQLIHFARLFFFFFPQKCIYLLRPEVPGDAVPARPALPSTPDPLIAITQQLSEGHAEIRARRTAPGAGATPSPPPPPAWAKGFTKKEGRGGGKRKTEKRKKTKQPNPPPPLQASNRRRIPRTRRAKSPVPFSGAAAERPPPPRVLTPAPKGSRGDVEHRRCSGDHRTNGEPCSRLAAAGGHRSGRAVPAAGPAGLGEPLPRRERTQPGHKTHGNPGAATSARSTAAWMDHLCKEFPSASRGWCTLGTHSQRTAVMLRLQEHN
ncbi:collagen alpha-1(I) chain-like [Harpia harpyja]|uniref:collagen alpha-1(I) chain-like n=1 Tax=Harpia harpyja TaxID=202280 RepID=UPI0022B17D5C|nr:collagen alpha-1(I) chain-like [Harpia harpyja]